MMLDPILAVAHHLAVFTLFASLFAQVVTVQPSMDAPSIRRICTIDVIYGLAALSTLVIGVARASLAAKGWEYYEHNVAFWAKLGVFALIGLISIRPTIAYRRWRREGASPSTVETLEMRRRLYAQLALFPLLPVLAVAMAHGYGQF